MARKKKPEVTDQDLDDCLSWIKMGGLICESFAFEKGRNPEAMEAFQVDNRQALRDRHSSKMQKRRLPLPFSRLPEHLAEIEAKHGERKIVDLEWYYAPYGMPGTVPHEFVVSAVIEDDEQYLTRAGELYAWEK